MIKNVVFDLGQVMVRFEPSYMVARYVSNETDRDILAEVVFDRLYWDRLDAGTITDSEVMEGCKSRLPKRLWTAAEKIYYNWIYNIPEIEGMAELVQRIKVKYKKHVFLLSNISTYFADHAKEISVLAPVERCIFSAVCGMVKPNCEIFEYLCKKCNIAPQETLFVDDNSKNIEGAACFGIKGYLFDGDVARLERYIDELFANE